MRKSRILTLGKLTAKEIYLILILFPKNKPTSKNYYESSFLKYTFDWKQICLLPCVTTINSCQCNFQYKILQNKLDLNKKPYIFGKSDSLLCSSCHSNGETFIHLLCEYVRVSQLWIELKIFFSNDLDLPLLTSQTAIFHFLALTDKCIFKITNHLLLTFKIYIYKS